jgi:hypothetical protein
MREVLAFSAVLTAAAFFISSLAVFWPEFREAQKRGAAGTEDETGAAGAGAADTGRPGYCPRYNIAGPEDMKRYFFDSSAYPAAEEEEKEDLTLAARD